MRNKFSIITETYITEIRIESLTFPIQVLKFLIAFLEIANILWFLITSVEEIAIASCLVFQARMDEIRAMIRTYIYIYIGKFILHSF